MPLNLLNENRNMHLLACRLFALQFLEAPRRACMVHHSIYNHYAFLIPTPLYPTSAELLNPNKFSRISPFQKKQSSLEISDAFPWKTFILPRQNFPPKANRVSQAWFK